MSCRQQFAVATVQRKTSPSRSFTGGDRRNPILSTRGLFSCLKSSSARQQRRRPIWTPGRLFRASHTYVLPSDLYPDVIRGMYGFAASPHVRPVAIRLSESSIATLRRGTCSTVSFDRLRSACRLCGVLGAHGRPQDFEETDKAAGASHSAYEHSRKLFQFDRSKRTRCHLGLLLRTHSALALEACVPASQDRDIALNVPNHRQNLFYIGNLCKSHIDLHQFVQCFDCRKDSPLGCDAHHLCSILAKW